jgi:hypothetical protein
MKGKFFHCSKCGKRMIERLPNGIWKFIFGGKDNPPIQMYIAGNVKMRCFRRIRLEDGSYEECGHWNTFSFWPHPKYNNPAKGREENLAETPNINP